MRRAQLSIEFIMILSMAIIIGTLFLASAAELFQRESERQRIASLNDIGYNIQDELILASDVADGYERTFIVPQRADRFVYSLVSDDGYVRLTSGRVTISYSLPSSTGSVEKGENTVEKRNGLVTVS